MSSRSKVDRPERATTALFRVHGSRCHGHIVMDGRKLPGVASQELAIHVIIDLLMARRLYKSQAVALVTEVMTSRLPASERELEFLIGRGTTASCRSRTREPANASAGA